MSPAERGVLFLHIVSVIALVASLATLIANRRLRGKKWPPPLRFLAEVDFIVMAFLGMLVGGSYMLEYGLRSGRELGNLDRARAYQFRIASVYPGDPNEYFPTYFARGSVPALSVAETVVRVRPYTFAHNKAGNTLEVLANPGQPLSFTWALLYDEAAPFIRFAGFVASWRIFIGALLVPVGALLLWGRLHHPEIVTTEHDVVEEVAEDDA